MARAASFLAPALAGYLFTYYNAKAADERKARIERVNDQVRLLYGPLLAAVHAARAAHAAMVRGHSPDGSVAAFAAAARADPAGPEGAAYRHWMREVLQPLNERAAAAIVGHVDLLEGAAVEPALLQFVAHVSAYRVCLKRWAEGALDEWSAVPYPDALPEYAEREFKRVKRRQAELLGIRRGGEKGAAAGPLLPLRAKL
jgi:hypothetical protein